MKNVFFLSLILFYSIYYFYGCTSKEIVKEKTAPETKIDTLVKIDSLIKIDSEKVESIKKEIKGKNISPTFSFISLLDAITTNDINKVVTVKLKKEYSYNPIREEDVKSLYSFFKAYLGDRFKNYTFHIKTAGYDIEELIPNYYRSGYTKYDYNRIPRKKKLPDEIIRNISKKYYPVKGLLNRNIALWPSHGWYYENKEGRWKWQRARLFQTVEDLLPFSFVTKYLTPMLENAGANVFMPRERDIQKNEIVVDNDYHTTDSFIEQSNDKNHLWKDGLGKGFGYGNPPYPNGLNPFEQGSYRMVQADSVISAEVDWIPVIPETGYYSVYISYVSSPIGITDAHYTVYHMGGITNFLINQQIGGKTWEYLGEFKFLKGYHPESGKIVLTNESSDFKKLIVTADAVRFGGGMGVISREGSTSGRPKFTEGARYWLQYSGMPAESVYDLNDNQNDYNDDYQSRGEYVNYLYGIPFGPNKNRNVKGLGIPIDLSLAFHTNAGVTNNDTTYGTMAIYSIEDFNTSKNFPDGVSRMANRDLADIIQTQVVDDIRQKYDTTWNRRMLFNSKYSEAARPNVPSVLLELLSHQNFLDMKFALDPGFQFDVSRAIYKGVLKFLSVQYNYNYVVQPLPVSHFTSSLSNDTVLLRWRPEYDQLENTATVNKYIVYTRINDSGFDNGQIVLTPEIKLAVDTGKIYSFKVTALNDGGESFPSEILSVCKMQNRKPPVLIINGFDRVAAPASVDSSGFSGFLNFIDAGVPYKQDVSFTGTQYNFDSSSKFISNDAPGYGASNGNYETQIIAGNSFDFPYIHGKSLKANGFSFISSSRAAASDGMIDLKKYKFIDLILGEEKSTHRERVYLDSAKGLRYQTFPDKLIQKIKDYCLSGGNLFISGAYVGSDLFYSKDPVKINFANTYLKFNWDTDHASKTGKFQSSSSRFLPGDEFAFNVELNDSIYAVEAPDAITPTDESETIFRYSENRFSAAVAFKKNYGVITFGFPFETILGGENREQIMKAMLQYFGLL